ncbi:MAG: cell division protein ZipA [Gammaproteobacteria bacterium]
MEAYLRLGLLFLAALIFFLILLEAVMRRRRLKSAAISSSDLSYATVSRAVSEREDGCTISLPRTGEPKLVVQQQPESVKADDSYIVISVFAKPNLQFASYELMQAISSTGMEFGEMNIFHYYLKTDKGRATLFSLASATKPGDFDLDRIGDFSCSGLTLFMDLKTTVEPEFAFNKMLVTAEQLAEDLDGVLYAAPRKPLTSEILQQYRHKIEQFHR